MKITLIYFEPTLSGRELSNPMNPGDLHLFKCKTHAYSMDLSKDIQIPVEDTSLSNMLLDTPRAVLNFGEKFAEQWRTSNLGIIYTPLWKSVLRRVVLYSCFKTGQDMPRVNAVDVVDLFNGDSPLTYSERETFGSSLLTTWEVPGDTYAEQLCALCLST